MAFGACAAISLKDVAVMKMLRTMSNGHLIHQDIATHVTDVTIGSLGLSRIYPVINLDVSNL